MADRVRKERPLHRRKQQELPVLSLRGAPAEGGGDVAISLFSIGATVFNRQMPKIGLAEPGSIVSRSMYFSPVSSLKLSETYVPSEQAAHTAFTLYCEYLALTERRTDVTCPVGNTPHCDITRESTPVGLLLSNHRLADSRPD